MHKFFESYVVQCGLILISWFTSAFASFYLGGALYYCSFALALLFVLIGCYIISQRSHKKLLEKHENETALSVLFLMVFNVLIMISVLVHEKNIFNLLLQLMVGDYYRKVATIRVSSFFCALSGVLGLTKRNIYFDASMGIALCIFLMAVLAFGNCIYGST